MSFQIKPFQCLLLIAIVLKTHLEVAQGPISCMYMHPMHLEWFLAKWQKHSINQIVIIISTNQAYATLNRVYIDHFQSEKP